MVGNEILAITKGAMLDGLGLNLAEPRVGQYIEAMHTISYLWAGLCGLQAAFPRPFPQQESHEGTWLQLALYNRPFSPLNPLADLR